MTEGTNDHNEELGGMNGFNPSMASPDGDGALEPELLAALAEQLGHDAPAAPGRAAAMAPVPRVPSFDMTTPAAPGVPSSEMATPPSMPSPGMATPSAPTMFDPQLLMALIDPGIEDAQVEVGLRRLVAEAYGGSVTSPPEMTQDFYFLPAPAEEEIEKVEAPVAPEGFEVETVRQDFPILEQTINGRPLVWLDNAATTQKPQSVIDRLKKYYETENSNVHRGAHTLAARATDGYEKARESVRRFIGAGDKDEIVFVRGTTEAINLVAQSYGRSQLGPGDEIVLTTLEHHSNIVPWQLLAQETGAVLRVVPITDRGEIMLEDYARMVGPRTKIVAVSHVSNALGTVVPVKEMAEIAHRAGAVMVVDGAQAVSHFPVNVQELGADFYAFSGHKLFGPTGIGALYGRKDLLEAMPPWQGGGSMIDRVKFEGSTFAKVPQKFEAGTPIIGGAIGLGAAIEYVERIGLENIHRHEQELTSYAMQALDTVPGLKHIGTAPDKVGVLSFVLEGIPTEELGKYLDQHGIAVRAGHHCAQPTMDRYEVNGTVRPSLALYNTTGDIDRLVEALKEARITYGPR